MYFLLEKGDTKNGTSRIVVYGSFPPTHPPGSMLDYQPAGWYFKGNRHS